MTELRRFPRIPHRIPLTIKVAAQGGGALVMSAMLENMSCHGAEVTMTADDRLVPGSMVELQVRLEEIPLSIPARVVWLGGEKAGLRLRLGDASEVTRKLYGRWIVPLTNQAIKQLQSAT